MMADVRTRPARPAEAATLSAVAQRSTAHWCYDAALLEACRPDLTFSEDTVRRGRFVLAERDVPVPTRVPDVPDEPARRIVGFYEIGGDRPEFELSNLWVEPDAIGTGVRRSLWTHAMKAAREMDDVTFVTGAEPNALGFYWAMGAIQVGETPSGSIPSRLLS
jgi:ribosomal protein S18 acetylase RimI-like enzyme